MSSARQTGVWAVSILGIVGLVILILYVVGVFGDEKVKPGKSAVTDSLSAPEFTATVTLKSVPVWYEAVGTVRSKLEANVASQVTGKIIEIRVKEGSSVKKGDLIATLVNDEFKARFEQARSGVDAAMAVREKATLGYARIQRLFAQEAATKEQIEAADALKKQADAGVEAARQKLEEARVSMGYTRIGAPLSGVVARREVDPGDLAWPGKTLVTIHDPNDLHLEASVREGLVGKVTRGQKVDVSINALGIQVKGTIEEIVPAGDPVSRSFLVKVKIPSAESLYPGMFGKLRYPVGVRKALVIPADAVTAVGQLETVLLELDGRWVRRFVTVGETEDGWTEILSGVSSGQTVGRGSGRGPDAGKNQAVDRGQGAER